MVTFVTLVAIFNVYLCAIRAENKETEKADNWSATGAKADVMRFIKQNKAHIDDTTSSESSDTNEYEEIKIKNFNKPYKDLIKGISKVPKKFDLNRSHDKEKNKDRKNKSQTIEKKKHIDRNEEIKESKKSTPNQNKNRNRNKEKYHTEERSREKSRVKERMKSRNRDKERTMNANRNPEKMPEVFRLNENNPIPTTDRFKDMNINKLLPPVMEKNKKTKSDNQDKNSKIGVSAPPDPSNLRIPKKAPLGLRSTRMPPMSLNQLDDPVTTPTKWTKSNSGTPPNTLSPYAIMEQMKIVIDCFPHANATFETIGRTVEYNDIIIVKITDRKQRYFRADESKYIDEVPEKKIIFIVHGLSVMGMTKMLHLSSISELKILMSYYLNHLDKFDIFLIPLANPDGYSLSHNVEYGMMWNKNASPQEACRGVYLDRNFDVSWNSTRQISSCSQLYPGPAPFSEVETNAVRNIFHYFGHKILAYINVHSGTFDDKVFKGDAILYPRGYTELQTDDDKYIDLKGEVDESMKNASFQVMSVAVDTLYNWYGKISGSSVDYASTVYGIPYALEFVMQLYQEEGTNYSIQHFALTEIWNRLIDTVFNNMWKSLHGNDVRKK
ncbi:unnamed protein product [Spodoptera littoralis]|uniref:Peptidase M14 domain-containing protein n=1 Tax=Spodoptera littoralis TaxID=7109 RepID=A0A9P0I4T6_SPOLI|nr:unnamed protein product [Spodoptera littoralis]CAH1640227.1 unnamed protein product [Spodoptera littoralis]